MKVDKKITSGKEKEKIELEPRSWGKFPLITPVVIITTINKEDIPNAAIKSWLMPIEGNPCLIMFACSMQHHTAKNILATKEFVVNIPNNNMAKKALITAEDYPEGIDEIKEAQLTPIPSVKVRPPSIAECIAHIECVFRECIKFEIGVWGNLFIGEVVYSRINREIIETPEKERYKLLDQMFSYCIDGTMRPDKEKQKCM